MSQVFKNYFSKNILFDFLDSCCDKSKEKEYISRRLNCRFFTPKSSKKDKNTIKKAVEKKTCE